MSANKNKRTLIPKSKKEKIILMLESLKDPKLFLYRGNSLAFASRTLELVKIAVGEKSQQYSTLYNLMYDNTGFKLERKIMPTDSLIVGKVKENRENFNGLIDSCIEQVNTLGLYKSPSEKKNFLSNIDNRFLWTLLVAFATFCFFIGKGYCKYNLEKFINDEPIVPMNVLQEAKTKKTTELQTFDSLKN
jgi:hypothetical protein